MASNLFDSSTYYTSPPLTPEMVAAAEAALGYRLPAAYVQLLHVKNGGALTRQCYPTAGTSWSDNHVRVTRICGIGGRWGIDSPENGSRHAIEQAGFPDVGIFIGWTPTAGHDGVLLDYSQCGPTGEPRIVHIDAESGDTIVLASCFDDFLKGLVDCRPYDEQEKRAMDEYRKRQ